MTRHSPDARSPRTPAAAPASDQADRLDAVLPRDYAGWRDCIERKCSIPLTRAYIEQRLRILSDPALEETRRFVSSYGEAHLAQVLAWFTRAREEADG